MPLIEKEGGGYGKKEKYVWRLERRDVGAMGKQEKRVTQ
jgi:hypothetical protein